MKGSKGHTTKSPLLTNYPTCQRRDWSTLNRVGAGAQTRTSGRRWRARTG